MYQAYFFLPFSSSPFPLKKKTTKKQKRLIASYAVSTGFHLGGIRAADCGIELEIGAGLRDENAMAGRGVFLLFKCAIRESQNIS